jgi:hypothetical protein
VVKEQAGAYHTATLDRFTAAASHRYDVAVGEAMAQLLAFQGELQTMQRSLGDTRAQQAAASGRWDVERGGL